MGDITRSHFSCSYATNNNIILFSSNTLSHSVERRQMFRAAIREDLIAPKSSLNHITISNTSLLYSVVLILFIFPTGLLRNSVTATRISAFLTYTTVSICVKDLLKDCSASSEWCVRKRKPFQWI